MGAADQDEDIDAKGCQDNAKSQADLKATRSSNLLPTDANGIELQQDGGMSRSGRPSVPRPARRTALGACHVVPSNLGQRNIVDPLR